MQEVPDLIGADGGKPPIRPLNIEMIDEFLPTIRRFVARFVALDKVDGPARVVRAGDPA